MSKNWEIKRGDVFYIYKFGNTVGSEQESGRPAVIVSNDENNKHSPTVEIVYLTTKPKEALPTHCKIKATSQESTVLCEQITTVAIERIGDFVGTCNTEEMKAIDKALKVSIGLYKKAEPLDENKPKREESVSAEIVINETNESVQNQELIKLQIERDTYKNLYEGLLNKLIPSGCGATLNE